METEILEFINKCIRNEKGNIVTISSKLADADLDSFGITVLFLDLDTEYDYFADLAPEIDPFTTIDFPNITIKEMVTKCL